MPVCLTALLGVGPGGGYWETVSEDKLRELPDYLSDERDYTFERELSRNGSNLRSWLSYLKVKKAAGVDFRFALYLRALGWLPRSYKLWMAFFDELELWVEHSGGGSNSGDILQIDKLYVRAIASLPKLPKLRLRYANFLWKYRKQVTATRRTYDEALRAIPLTQHELIWKPYMEFVAAVDIPAVTISVLKRYIQIEPSYTEALIGYLISVQRNDEAVELMCRICSDDSFESIEGKTRQDLWIELCTFIAKHARDIKSVDGAKIIRSALRRYVDSVATLWCCLATYHAILEEGFDLAVNIYEEALVSVHSVEDFTIVYDAYTQYLDSAVQTQVDKLESGEITEKIQLEVQKEIDFRMGLLAELIDRRGEMLSAVRIRRSPHNVYEWLSRVQLFCRPKVSQQKSGGETGSAAGAVEGDELQLGQQEHITAKQYDRQKIQDPAKVIETFGEAVITIDPFKANGPISMIWIEFAKFYELFDDITNARKVLERGCQAEHKTLDSLASVWCERIELELRHDEYQKALTLARSAVQKPSKSQQPIDDEEERRPQARLYKSVKLWSLCADLEENFGTFDSLKAAYDAMFDTRTITVQQILIYAELLEKKKYFEDAFQVYERGLHNFRWPHALDIWLVYLSKFVSRYGHRKLDRARELFEEAVSEVPKAFAFKLFFMYAKFEEQYGLIRNALAVYHRATKRVPHEDKLKVYEILIAATAEYFGIAKTRPLYEDAIKNVMDSDVLTIGLKYAEMEANLMEVDRARAIFEHISQFADPVSAKGFWSAWRSFEVANGDEETFREMLRKRRAVASQFEEAKSLQFDDELLKELRDRTGQQQP